MLTHPPAYTLNVRDSFNEFFLVLVSQWSMQICKEIVVVMNPSLIQHVTKKIDFTGFEIQSLCKEQGQVIQQGKNFKSIFFVTCQIKLGFITTKLPIHIFFNDYSVVMKISLICCNENFLNHTTKKMLLGGAYVQSVGRENSQVLNF